MSQPVSHESYEILQWPDNAAFPSILYLKVGEDIVAAATYASGGWRIVLFQDADTGEPASVGANVADSGDALAWLKALGHLAAAGVAA